jgi:predicted TIM-barrel fold metal-dependent hydrolase
MFDVANLASPPALAALMDVSSTTQMLFGTDHPLVTVSTTVDGLDHYGFSDAELEAINRNNAIRLFPRPKG